MYILFFSLFHFGCNNFVGTPEDALQTLNDKEDSMIITNIISEGSNSQKRQFYLFETEVNGASK